jgi:hypothetical protein
MEAAGSSEMSAKRHGVTERVVLAVMLQTRFQDVFSSNLGLDTFYPG